MKKTLLSIFTLITSATMVAQCSEVFMSEYVEGWSNNKAIEIYNPTASAIDLSSYELRRYSNGSSSADPSTKRISLSGSVAAYGTYVFVLDKRDTAGMGQDAPVWDSLQAKADAFINPVYNTNNVMYFNGNDAITLFKGAVLVDVIGKVGEDPGAVNGSSSQDDNYGWPHAEAIAWTKDHTMRRKSSIQGGNTNATPAVYTPSTEWDSLVANTFTGLGAHECTCDPNFTSINEIAGNVKFNVYPNPSNTGVVSVRSEKEIKSIRVINLVGAVVYENNVNNIEFTTINTGNWNKGMYLITLDFGSGVKSTRKITIN